MSDRLDGVTALGAPDGAQTGAPDGCALWLLDLRSPVAPAHWQDCGPEEHARASRFRFERDAARYRAAHALMRQVLGRQLGTLPKALRWRRGSHGKPHLLDHEGWHFNLAHSGDWGLVGLARHARIGVDIECHQPRIDTTELAGQHFTRKECDALAACPPAGRAAFFYRIWAAKEAALKALGCGLMLSPADISAPWQQGWTPAVARWEGTVLTPRVHGIVLPEGLRGTAEAAVSLWDPRAPGAGTVRSLHRGIEDW